MNYLSRLLARRTAGFRQTSPVIIGHSGGGRLFISAPRSSSEGAQIKLY